MELVRRTIRMTRQKGKAVSQMTLDDDIIFRRPCRM